MPSGRGFIGKVVLSTAFIKHLQTKVAESQQHKGNLVHKDHIVVQRIFWISIREMSSC